MNANDLIGGEIISEGHQIPTSEVVSRIKAASKKAGIDSKDLINRWYELNGGKSMHDASKVSKMIRKLSGGKVKTKKNKTEINPKIAKLADMAELYDIGDAVIYMIDNLGLETRGGKLAGKLNKLNPFTEDMDK